VHVHKITWPWGSGEDKDAELMNKAPDPEGTARALKAFFLQRQKEQQERGPRPRRKK
jgi:hypothetical protein